MKKIVIICLIIFLSLSVVGTLFLTSKYAVKLNGEKLEKIEVNTEYKEKGAKSILNLGKIKIEGKVDTNKIGTYEINYRYFYSTITKKVEVVDTQEPEINLKGSNEILLSINGTYVEPGYSATDNYDGDITSKVVIKDNIDTKKSGLYEIKYTVTDSSGNETSLKRTVSVNEKGPLTQNLKEFSLDGYFDSTILKETDKQGDNYINETVFYGDSITYNFAYYESLPWNVIWATSSLTPENALTWTVPINPHKDKLTLVDAAKKYQPKRLIISLGANAVAVMSENYFIKSYETLVTKVKEASPNTLLIVQSIFPVDSKWDTSSNSKNTINNTKINRLNYLLAEMCERQKIKFLNSAPVLKDENGACKKGYCYYSDGIHPLPDGNKRIIEYVKTHAYIEGE